jgi:hypothetical protein
VKPQKISATVVHELDRLEKRLEKLENEEVAKEAKSGIINKTILEDVRHILYS